MHLGNLCANTYCIINTTSSPVVDGIISVTAQCWRGGCVKMFSPQIICLTFMKGDKSKALEQIYGTSKIFPFFKRSSTM